MTQPKISIIMPVYNAEKYIHKAVDSILAQTLTEFELICIDDGSIDNSAAILDNYSVIDKRIHIIHQPNRGVSMARQHGLDTANGEYVIHVDPDDWVEPNMLEDLYSHAQQENADMVICDFYVNTNEVDIYRKQEPTSLDHYSVMCNMFQHIHGSCCNKLIRKKCFDNYSIKFTSWLSFCEDLCINTQLLKNKIKISYLPKAYYHYVTDVNTNSIVKKLSLETLEYDLKVYDFLETIVKDTPAHHYFEKQFSKTCTIRAFRSGLLSSKKFKCIYGKFANNIWDKKSFAPNNIMLYFSCKGFYRLCYIINKYLPFGRL